MNKLPLTDIIKLIKKIQNREDEDDIQLINWTEEAERQLGSTEIHKLIFHHRPELTPEEIVEKALSYKPIITPPPPASKDKKDPESNSE